MKKIEASLLGLFVALVGTATLSAQTVYIPSGTSGIGNNTANSDVGIGTATPNASIDIWKSYYAGTDSLRFSFNDGSAYWMGIQPYVAGGANVGYRFRTNNGSTTVDALSITGDGKIGLGTTNPVSKLHLQDTQTELSMGTTGDSTAYNRFGFNTNYYGYWTQNAYWTGTQWNYVNAGGYAGAAVKLQEYYGSFQIDTASGSANPVPWNTRLYVANGGNVGIGTTTPSHKLAVNGTIRAKEVIVDTGWSDYVFAEDYRLAPLSEVERHIKAEKHLPGIPSAAEVAEHGVSMGDMQSKLLAKVEELTLHLIAQEKAFAGLKHENSVLAARLLEIESTLDKKP